MKKKTDWSQIDWSLRNWEIQEIVGASAQTVSTRRREAGMTGQYRRGQIREPGTSKRCKADWSTVDWAIKDVHIAAKLGVSHQAVNNMRQRKNYLALLKDSQ